MISPLLTLGLISVCIPSHLAAQTDVEFRVAFVGDAPTVTLDDSNNAVIAWANKGVFLKRFDRMGVPRSDSVKLTGAASVCRISFGHGGGIAVWRRPSNDPNSYIVGRLLSSEADTLSPELQINDDYFDAHRGSQQITALTDTSFVVAWLGNGPEKPSPQYGIFGQIISDSLLHIGMNKLLSDVGVNVIQGPVLAGHKKADHFLVAWKDTLIRYRLFTKEGVPISASLAVPDSTRLKYFNPSAQMDSSGNVVLAWNAQRLDSSWRNYRIRIDSQGNPVGVATAISDDNVITDYPIVTVDDDGKSVIAWLPDAIGGKYRLKAKRYDNQGIPYGPNFFISPQDTNDEYAVEIALKRDLIRFVWVSGIDQDVRARFVDFYNPILEVIKPGIHAPESFQLFQNYPNPFNPATTIVFSLFKQTRVELAIFDINGRLITEIVNKELPGGLYSITWNADKGKRELSSGTYFYRLSSYNGFQTKKMILVR